MLKFKIRVLHHLWGDDYLQLPDPLGFFGSAVPAAVDAGGLQGYGDRCSEDGIRSIVEFVVEVAWREMSMFGRTSPAYFFGLIPFPAGCTSDFVFISWSVLGQVVC